MERAGSVFASRALCDLRAFRAAHAQCTQCKECNGCIECNGQNGQNGQNEPNGQNEQNAERMDMVQKPRQCFSKCCSKCQTNRDSALAMLTKAAQRGLDEIVTSILDACKIDCDVNRPALHIRHPAMRVAIQNDWAKVVAAVARRVRYTQADLNEMLSMCTYKGSTAVAETLIQLKASVHPATLPPCGSYSVVMRCATHGHAELMNLLLRHKASVHDKDNLYKRTPLMASVIAGNPSVVALLLRVKSNVHGVDDFGESALCLARIFRKADTSLAKLLQRYVNATPHQRYVNANVNANVLRGHLFRLRTRT